MKKHKNSTVLKFNFDNNIYMIKVLNDTIGCVADDHDSKAMSEFMEICKQACVYLEETQQLEKDLKIEDEKSEDELVLSEEEKIKFERLITTMQHSTVEFKKAHRHLSKTAPSQGQILRYSAVILLMSCFETLISSLIREFYLTFPDAFPAQTKSLTLADLKELNSIEEAESHLIETEIDSILRGNLNSQLQYFEKPIKINIKPIDKYLEKIIEISQRRNIIVHNDGVINKQYLTKTPKHLISEENIEGHKIKVGKEYVSEYVNNIHLVGTILMHQCYRKWNSASEDIEKLNDQIIETIYDSLVDENYEFTIDLCDYGLNLKPLTDSAKKVIIINQAIALRETNKIKNMNQLLDSTDWSSSNTKFIMAYYLLKNKLNEFYHYAKKSIICEEISYKNLIEWPLFKNIRETAEFRDLIFENFPEIKQVEAAKDSLFVKSIEENPTEENSTPKFLQDTEQSTPDQIEQ